jgi:hypothetical protein
MIRVDTMAKTLNRRDFLATSSAAAVAPLVLGAKPLAAAADVPSLADSILPDGKDLVWRVGNVTQ